MNDPLNVPGGRVTFASLCFLLAVGLSPASAEKLDDDTRSAKSQTSSEKIAFFRERIAADPGDAWAHAMLGNAYNSASEYDKAIEEFKRALEIDPDYSYALQQLGQVLYFAKQYKDAGIALEKYLTRWAQDLTQEDQASLWTMLGVSRYRIYYDKTRSYNDLDRAEEAFLKAVELNPQDKDAYYGLPFVYLHRKWPVHLLWYAQKALELGETDNAAVLEQNISAMMESVAHGSIEARPPRDRIASSKDMSADELKAASGLRQDSPAWSALEAAIAGFDKYDSEKNQKRLSAVIDRYPDFAPARYNRGVLVLDRGRAEEAAADFKKTITFAPRWGRAHGALAACYIYLKNYRSARLELKEAAALDPDDPVTQFNQKVMTMFDKAVVDYQIAELKRTLEFVRMETDKSKIAKVLFGLTMFNPAKRVDPTSAEIQELHGDILTSHKQYWNAAIDYYEKAIELGGNRAEITAKIEKLKQ